VNRKASNIVAKEAIDGQPAAAGGTISFEDAALVERTKNGDMQAFGAIVAKYQDRVFNMIYRMCNHRDDAEELAQEAFCKALERLGQFRGHSGFYTWLFRIASNLVISHRRRDGRIRFHALDEGGGLDRSQAALLVGTAAERRDLSPAAAAVSAETERRIVRALDELDDEMRIAVILRDMEDMDYSQIADVLDIPAGTVKSRIHRGRAELRDKLADLIA